MNFVKNDRIGVCDALETSDECQNRHDSEPDLMAELRGADNSRINLRLGQIIGSSAQFLISDDG